MKSLHRLFLLLLMIAAVACSPAKKTASTNTHKLENALLWKIEGPDFQSPSYLFGTIHLIGKDEFFYPDGLLAAVDEVDRITFEIDIADMMDPIKQMGLMQKAFMRDNTSLKDLLTEDEYSLVKDHFDQIGMPLFFFERMQPMFLTVFGYSDVNPGSFQNGDMLSYEFELNKLAEQKNLETAGLETIEYQLSAIDSIPYDQQAQMLIESLRDKKKGADQLKLMVEMYTLQEIERMYSELGEDAAGSEEFEQILLTNRNKNWIPIIANMASEKPTLFAVGAGHLGGPQGVITLLKNQGYTLTPLSQVKN